VAAGWTGYPGIMPSIAGLKPRPARPGFSGREPFVLPERLQAMFVRARDEIAAPFVGLTTDGSAIPGLYALPPTGASVKPMVDAARAWLDALSPAERAAGTFPVDAPAWREWSNISPYLMRHGVLLEALDDTRRDLALELVRSTLSQVGYTTARDVMKLNEHIGEITGRWNEYGEWVYWLSIFGAPSKDKPWGWQIDGHHLIVNCLVLGDQIVLTPQFMGSEPVLAESGKYQGTRVFAPEEAAGYRLMSALSNGQQDEARIGMQLPFDAVATAPHDNLVMPYAGIRVATFDASQQRAVFELLDVFLTRWPAGHAQAKLAELRAHLDETYFAWIGPCDAESPFYYRLHSPVLWLEFDHQPGIALDNDEPSRNHIHTLIRTPNGNDYGKDLLRQHYSQHH
jgi:hypothetical protein